MQSTHRKYPAVLKLTNFFKLDFFSLFTKALPEFPIAHSQLSISFHFEKPYEEYFLMPMSRARKTMNKTRFKSFSIFKVKKENAGQNKSRTKR